MQSNFRFCPNCGVPLQEQQAFCSMCGAVLSTETGEPTHSSGAGESAGSSESIERTVVSSLPPPAPPSHPPTWPPALPLNQQPPNAGPQQAALGQRQPGYMPPPPTPSYGQQGAMPPPQPGNVPPPYARPQRNASRGVITGLSCSVLLIISLIVVVCGALSLGGYLLLRNFASTGATSSSSYSSGTSGSTTLHSNTPTSIPTRTFPVNGTLTYSSITITVVNVQLASSFPDDLNATNSATLLRVLLKENNGTNDFASYSYNEIARLILPDQTSVAPNALQYGGAPQPSSTRTNWLDFPVPNNVDVSHTLLRLGAPTEATMDIPLQNKPDLTKYDPSTTRPTNAQTTYAGLKWTVTETSVSWSAQGKQADSGKRFLTLSFRIDNLSNQDVGFNADDFMRLQVGSDRFPPTANTLHMIVKAGTTNQTGDVIFTLPEGTTACTVIMMQSDLLPNSQEAQIPLQLSSNKTSA
jgi:hypothetical protein